MNNHIKILFIHHAAGWGGAPNSMIKIINALDKKKYSSKVLLLKDSIVKERLIENDISYTIADSWFYAKYYRYFSHLVTSYIKWYQFRKFCTLTLSWILSRYIFAPRILKHFDADIIHLNSSVLTDFIIPAKKNAKVIIHVRETLSKGYFGVRHYMFTKYMLNNADIIIAISEYNKTQIGVSEKIRVVYNFTDIISDLDIIENSYYSKKVLYVGGAMYIKGFYNLVQALYYIDKEITIIFAGNYPQLEANSNSFKKKLKKCNKQYKQLHKALTFFRSNSNVVEVGSQSSIIPYIDECCCLVSPFSIEHFSRPVIEAFARKKPVIVTNLPGISEVVEHQNNGILVPNHNSKALASAIEEICNNPKKAKQMGIKGYEKAIDLYSPNNIQKIIDIYNNLTNEK